MRDRHQLQASRSGGGGGGGVNPTHLSAGARLATRPPLAGYLPLQERVELLGPLAGYLPCRSGSLAGYLPLQERVELLGAIAHCDVPRVLTRGHLFLNTSLTEACNPRPQRLQP